jgi:hypothetical protein
MGYFCTFQEAAEVNNHSLGENSSNLATLSGANPTIESHNASAAKIYSKTNSIVRF